MSKNIYLFSGLGADERVFHQLDFAGYSVHYIKWEIPLEKESIEVYATRLLTQITTPTPILIGLSFGGLIAVEVAKLIETKQVILIASAKTKDEIPFYYRWAGKLKLHKRLPTHLLKRKNPFSNLVFRNSSNAERELMNSIFEGTNQLFLNWAIDKVVNWENRVQLANIQHIHGTADRIFPVRYANCHIRIKDGGHLLTLKRPDEITEILRSILRQNEA